MLNIRVIRNLFIRSNEILSSRPSIWFIHGFADSGLVYKEVFNSALEENFNIYVVDMPGFGASPLNQKYSSIEQHAELLSEVISKEGSNKFNIVAHSLGSLVGTKVCQLLNDHVHYFFSIEGNLTEADSYFSSKPLNFDNSESFFASFENEIFETSKSKLIYRRYYSSLRLADPDGMRNWSFSSQELIKNNRCGLDFKNLKCRKMYIWGDVDTPVETQSFIIDHQIPNQRYQGVGHWHMIENSKVLYKDISELLLNS